MCGITAILSAEKPVLETALLQSMEQLSHRGPDAKRHWIAPDRHVGLAHTRLSVMDLATGDQPLANEDSRIHAVVNGEFYGFESIRSEMQQKGHLFKTCSDSEILLHLYEEYGVQCLHQLRGEFAFVLWDDKNKVLFAARDRFGIKPLHYTFFDNTLYIASEAKALFAAGVPAHWDHATVFATNAFHLRSGERTFFKNVFQIPPGHYLLVQGGHHRFVRYWDFDYPLETELPLHNSEKEYIQQFKDKLGEAIRVRLRSDVPVGCYLSGGIDSCCILGAAAEIHGRSLSAFTLGFDQAEYDETAIAREMAMLVGVELNLITVTQTQLAEHFSDTIWHSESLLSNTHAVAKFLLSQAVREAGYKVVLTGEGSDEILAGYATFRQDLLLHNRLGEDAQAVESHMQQLRESNRIIGGVLLSDRHSVKMDSVARILGHCPTAMATGVGRGNQFKSLFAKDFYEAFHEQDPLRLFLDTLDCQDQLKGRDPVNQSLYLWSKSMLPGYVLSNLGDRMEMAHSIEGRVPFLDHPLVEFVKTLPVSMKIKGVTEKYILREAMRPYVTETVYQRQKHPFLAPPVSGTLHKPMNALLQDTLRSKRFAAVPFYDQANVVALLDTLPHLPPETLPVMDTIFMEMLSACVLQERFGL